MQKAFHQNACPKLIMKRTRESTSDLRCTGKAKSNRIGPIDVKYLTPTPYEKNHRFLGK